MALMNAINSYVIGGNGTGYSQISHDFSFNRSNTKIATSNGMLVMEIPNDDPVLIVHGKIKFNGDDLGERLERIEDMLHIPQRDVIMEQKHEKLKALWAEYTQTLAALKTWDAIKEST